MYSPKDVCMYVRMFDALLNQWATHLEDFDAIFVRLHSYVKDKSTAMHIILTSIITFQNHAQQQATPLLVATSCKEFNYCYEDNNQPEKKIKKT